MKLLFSFFVFVLTFNATSFAGFSGDSKDRSTHFVVVPGQNGLGGQNAVENDVLNPFSSNEVTYIETPGSNPDLGQDRCIKFLDQAITSRQQ